MLRYLRSIWICRFFWLSLVQSDLQMRYRRSVLGIGWSMMVPLTTTLVTCLVFHEIFKTDIRTFAPFILSGLACWAYITGVAIQGCQSYVQAESYIRQHPLPIAIYPLRTTLVTLVHFVIALTMVMGLTMILRGIPDLVVLVYLVPGVLLLFFFGWALAILVGFMHLVFRDTAHALEVGFQVLFYLTPIIYPVQVLRDSRLGWLADYNPLLLLLDLIRQPILEAQPPPVATYCTVGAFILGLGILALASLRIQQRRVVLFL